MSWVNLKIKAAQQITVRITKRYNNDVQHSLQTIFPFILAFFNSLFHLPTHSCIQYELTEHLL